MERREEEEKSQAVKSKRKMVAERSSLAYMQQREWEQMNILRKQTNNLKSL